MEEPRPFGRSSSDMEEKRSDADQREFVTSTSTARSISVYQSVPASKLFPDLIAKPVPRGRGISTDDSAPVLDALPPSLSVLRHASQCLKRPPEVCLVAHCAPTRALWLHARVCTDDACPIEECRAARSLMLHYRKCTETVCKICGSSRRTEEEMGATGRLSPMDEEARSPSGASLASARSSGVAVVAGSNSPNSRFSLNRLVPPVVRGAKDSVGSALAQAMFARAGSGAVPRQKLALASQWLFPASRTDPDPGNDVPWRIRRTLRSYRLAFASVTLAIGIVAVTTPENFLIRAYREDPAKAWGLAIPGILLYATVLLAHYVVAGSDPGYLEVSDAVALKEAQVSQQKAAEYIDSSDEEEQDAHNDDSHEADLERLSRKTTPLSGLRMNGSTAAPRRRAPPSSGIGRVDEESVVGAVATEDDSFLNRRNGVKKSTSVSMQRKNSYSSSDSEPMEEDDEDLEAQDESTTLSEGATRPPSNASLQAVPSREHLPVRARFCRKSGKVVAMFDHYCAVLNTTIGERNRARFWLFLQSATLALAWCLTVIHSSFRDSVVDDWLYDNGHTLIVAILLWLIFVGVAAFFLFHTFLMMANMTTYEFLRADRVVYLARTRDFDLPFSMGPMANVRFYFASDAFLTTLANRLVGVRAPWKPHVWIKPNVPERDSPDVCANLWENKYWSCC